MLLYFVDVDMSLNYVDMSLNNVDMSLMSTAPYSCYYVDVLLKYVKIIILTPYMTMSFHLNMSTALYGILGTCSFNYVNMN